VSAGSAALRITQVRLVSTAVCVCCSILAETRNSAIWLRWNVRRQLRLAHVHDCALIGYWSRCLLAHPKYRPSPPLPSAPLPSAPLRSPPLPSPPLASPRLPSPPSPRLASSVGRRVVGHRIEIGSGTLSQRPEVLRVLCSALRYSALRGAKPTLHSQVATKPAGLFSEEQRKLLWKVETHSSAATAGKLLAKYSHLDRALVMDGVTVRSPSLASHCLFPTVAVADVPYACTAYRRNSMANSRRSHRQRSCPSLPLRLIAQSARLGSARSLRFRCAQRQLLIVSPLDGLCRVNHTLYDRNSGIYLRSVRGRFISGQYSAHQ
jgi:hypothetical protein